MRLKAGIVFLVLLFAVGCAHNPKTSPALSQSGATKQPQPIVLASASDHLMLTAADTATEDEDLDFLMEDEEEVVEIADPLEGFNRAMFHVNDKLYFWLLKPVAQGYNFFVPEGVRISVRNFFTHITFPIRFVNSILQGSGTAAAIELSRLAVNTAIGAGGLFDPAGSKDGPGLPLQKEDFGQTLGVWGLGHGFYLTWPVLGPSSPRDTVGLVGDYFLDPVFYVKPWYDRWAIAAYDRMNRTSLRIGDYEALKDAAIDPYIAIRNAWVQHRKKLVETRVVLPESEVSEK
jgi:phospholipid-binding lipoprotein MlaA